MANPYRGSFAKRRGNQCPALEAQLPMPYGGTRWATTQGGTGLLASWARNAFLQG